MSARRLFGIAVVLGALVCAPAAALAGPKEKSPAKPAAAPPQAAQKPSLPGTNKLTLLIQTHMSALSQAIATENYTVLRALGAPSFQDNNPPEKLSQTFGKFKAQGIDFSPVILYKPVLVQAPAIDASGMLRLKGLYKTEPQNVHFDMLFQFVQGTWRLFGISANMLPAESSSGAAQHPAQ